MREPETLLSPKDCFQGSTQCVHFGLTKLDAGHTPRPVTDASGLSEQHAVFSSL